MNKKEKSLVDREIEVYKRELQLEVDEDIFKRKISNWKRVDEARANNFSKQLEIKTETARLEAKKEALAEVLDIKDNEIALLKGLLEKAITALQTIKTIS